MFVNPSKNKKKSLHRLVAGQKARLALGGYLMISVADSGNLNDVAALEIASNVNFVLVFIWHCYVISPIPRLLEQVATWPFDEFIPSHASIVNVTNMGLIRRAD